MEWCCDKFRRDAEEVQSKSALYDSYPEDMEPTGQFEFADGEWNINGCCGGGCYVVEDMKFCPYCGTKLSPPQSAEGSTE